MQLVIDWSKAPDASPSSMGAYFFSTDGTVKNTRFNMPGRNGGRITLHDGNYEALVFNNDNTEWAYYHGTDDIETFEIRTGDAYALSSLGLEVRSIPKAPVAEDERIAFTPEMMWNTRVNEIQVHSNGDSTIVCYPEEAVCHYTVTVKDIENYKYLKGVTLDATLSGLGEGFSHGSHSPTLNPATMIFSISENPANETLHGEFLTFGVHERSQKPNIVTIYMVFEDESAYYFNYDVTRQIKSAPDPRHVDIVISGLTVPRPIANGSGFQPSVDDWRPIYIDIDI